MTAAHALRISPIDDTLQAQPIPSLDGIRAVAAVLVFGSHAGLANIIPGGFGVTIFFFLSGYLITTLLRQEFQRSGTVSLRKFYLRRVYRILPPMYLVLFSILILSLAIGMARHVSPLAVLAQIGHMTNYYIIASGDAALVPDTSVYWSLAVEEHFYLVFPLLFLLLMRRYRLHRVAWILFLICMAVLIWRTTLVGLFPNSELMTAHVFYSTDTRFDSLLFGCIMGVWSNPFLDTTHPFGASKVKTSIAVAALLMLLFTMVYRDEFFQRTLRYTLQGFALFPLFWIAVRHAQSPFVRWLSWWPLRWLGIVSYVFYLSHHFWLHVARVFELPTANTALLAFTFTLAFSALVHWKVERPFARMRRSLSNVT